jgi:hypothetical protein
MGKRTYRQAMRSGHSSCDICNKMARLVEHHIHGREVAGWRDGWNVAWVCPTCHDQVHAGDVVVEGWFRTTDGRELVWRLRNEEPKLREGASPPKYK